MPDNIYVTIEDIINFISENRDKLREDYAALDLHHFRNICNLTLYAGFDKCLDSICNYSNFIKILDEKIPKSLYRILERLWRNNQIIIFPSHDFPDSLHNFLDRTHPDHEKVIDFVEQYSKSDKEKLKNLISDFQKSSKTSENKKIRIRSNIFEIIRLIPKISYTPQIPNYNCERRRRNPFRFRSYTTPNISFVKYVQERKRLPPRNITLEELFSNLKSIVNEGYICRRTNERIFAFKDFNQATLLQSLEIIKETLSEPQILGKDGRFSIFQKNSILHIFLNLFLDDSECGRWCNEKDCRLSKKNLTIVADTGAGKTFGFLIAPLIYIAFKHLENPGFRVAQKPMCLFIYPRRDLAFDQFTNFQKISQLVNKISEGKVRINVGRDYGGNIEYTNKSLIVCNTEAFKRRLADPNKNKYIDPDFLNVIVLDEIHLYSSILGLHIIYFLRRLGSFLKSKYYKQHRDANYRYPIVIGASATIAMPEKHSEKLFSIGYDWRGSKDRYRRIWVENAIGEKASGKRALFHHILMLPKRLANLLGTLTDLTSAVLHNNPDPKYPLFYESVEKKGGKLSEKERKSIAQGIGKSLLFLDSLSGINRLHQYLSETEKRNIQVTHDEGTNNFMSITIYDKPAKFFPALNIHSNGSWDLDIPNYNQIVEGSLICKFCKREVDFKNISLRMYLENGRDVCSLIPFNSELRITTILDGCKFFNDGICWWFSRFPFIRLHDAPLRSNNFTFDSYVPIRRTAKLRGLTPEIGDINQLFVDFIEELPYLIRHRLAIVSPVFEVGVDISNVKDVVTYKTIRNLASYKQKTGRGGREIFSDTPIYTLISHRILDRFIYRNPDIIRDPSYLDPVSLKEHNTYFLKSHIFQAIFDYLAIWSNEYKDIFHYYKMIRNPDVKKSNLLRYMELKEKNIKNHLKYTFSYYEKPKLLHRFIEEALEDFKERLNIFFSDVPRNIRNKLGISKSISREVEKIDRQIISELLGESREPEEILFRLKKVLGLQVYE